MDPADFVGAALSNSAEVALDQPEQEMVDQQASQVVTGSEEEPIVYQEEEQKAAETLGGDKQEVLEHEMEEQQAPEAEVGDKQESSQHEKDEQQALEAVVSDKQASFVQQEVLVQQALEALVSDKQKSFVQQEVLVQQAPEAVMGEGEKSLVDGGGDDGGDGPIKVEGDGEEGDPLAMFSKKKKDKFLKKVSLSAALVLMLAMTSWLLYKKVVAPPVKPPLPSVEEQIDFYINKSREMAEVLDEVWTKASKKVQRVFTTHYMPSLKNEHVPESKALSYYKMHVLEMCRLAKPAPQDDIETKTKHLHKLQMVTSLVDAATQRIQALITMEESELPALILDKEASGKQQTPFSQENIDFSSFAYELNQRGFQYTARLVPRIGRYVPAAKALPLFNLLLMEDKMIAVDKRIHEAFDHYLKGQGLSLETLKREDASKVAALKLPNDTTEIDAKTFVQFLHSRYNSDDAVKFRTETLDFLARNWLEKDIEDAIKKVKENHEKALEDLIRQKRDTLSDARRTSQIPLNHGFALAVFLL